MEREPIRLWGSSGNGAVWGSIIIVPEYKPLDAACRSPGARKSAVSGEQEVNRQGAKNAKGGKWQWQ
ncbi:MAG: hypothetical protein J3T61_07940 [Candidatus Brocadiales bacterium]|nr:hypothetical protein [Candidatus Bathyanammoxibius sp.]